ncbi:MAG: sulfotransferase [Verrucomicrobiota bacterium]
MAKIVAIDGLARSGTTWLTAIVNSHPRSKAWRGVFHEPLACKHSELMGRWSDFLVRLEIANPASPVDVYSKNYPLSLWRKLRQKFESGLALDYDYLWDRTLETMKRRDQFGNWSRDDLESLREQFDRGSLESVDELYQTLAGEHRVLAFRWNQGLFYALKWLSRPNHRLIVPIRDPRDRACSSNLAHHSDFDGALSASRAFAETLKIVWDRERDTEKMLLVYYEDLVDEPQKSAMRILDWLGLEGGVDLENLFWDGGQPYRIETSDLCRDGVNHRSGMVSKGKKRASVGRYLEEMPKEVQQLFDKEFSADPFYNRYFG